MCSERIIRGAWRAALPGCRRGATSWAPAPRRASSRAESRHLRETWPRPREDRDRPRWSRPSASILEEDVERTTLRRSAEATSHAPIEAFALTRRCRSRAPRRPARHPGRRRSVAVRLVGLRSRLELHSDDLPTRVDVVVALPEAGVEAVVGGEGQRHENRVFHVCSSR